MSTNMQDNPRKHRRVQARLTKTCCNEVGQAVVEFALVMIMLVREGARFGTTQAPSGSSQPDLTSIRQRVLQTATLDLVSNQISATCSPDCYQGSNLTVIVNYTFQPATPLFWQFTMTGRSTMVIEYPRP